MRISIFIGLILVIASCSELQKPEQLNSLDELQYRVDSLRTVCNELQSIDFSSIQENRAAIIYMVSHKSDTINLNTAVLMDKYLIATGELDDFRSQLLFLDSTLNVEDGQLQSLRNDINGALGKRNMYNEYIVLEAARIDSLELIADQVVQTYDRVSLASEQYHDSLVLELARFN